ncbi:hypothetical protein FKM82_011708 [Ascaphus truei]
MGWVTIRDALKLWPPRAIPKFWWHGPRWSALGNGLSESQVISQLWPWRSACHCMCLPGQVTDFYGPAESGDLCRTCWCEVCG